MKKLSLTLITVTGVLLGVILVRTVSFKSRQIHPARVEGIRVDQEASARRLSQAIRFKTISFRSPREDSAAEFPRFAAFIAQAFPRVNAQLTKEAVNEFSLLYTWKGKDERLKPILLMGHMDVVPVDPPSEKSWTQAPFSGQIVDGFIWGRGAMDDKVSVMGILETVENLLAQGFQPQRTIFLAFGHDEEIGGNNGAAKIAALLASRKIALEFVLDEGMNILSGIVDGVSAPVALIGIAEKGYLTIQLSAQAAGGHSSIPPVQTAIGSVARALQRLAAAPFPAKLDGPTRQMFDFLGPEMSFPKRLALANLWLFEPLVRREMSALPLTNAILRTTLAPTIFHAGVKENVLPTQASATVNLRIMPGETSAGALARVRKIVDDPQIKLTAQAIRIEPSAVTDINGPSFKLLHQTIRQVAPEAIVAPALLVAATDSRHYAGLTKNVLRFLPVTLKAGDTTRYHGIDERISITDYERCIQFYAQLIRNSDRL